MEYTEQHLLELLAASLCGEELSREEEELLEDWKTNPENHRKYEHYKQLFGRREELALWEKLKKRPALSLPAPRRRSFGEAVVKTWVKYAAVLLPFAGILCWLYWQNPSPSKVAIAPEIVRNDIAPGQPKARLLLEDGETVTLTDSSMSIRTRQDILVGKGGVLQYAANQDQTLKKAVYHTLAVDRGAEFQLVLPDGTKVWLNSDSRLRYPDVFNEAIRKVYLEGEAYFEVAHLEKQPFIVSGEKYDIRVLGTKFNVSCYAGEQQVVATLVEGKIAYRTGEQQGELQPGWQCLYDTEKRATEVRKVNVAQYISWKNGLFIFENIRMEELAKQMERWYNVDVVFTDNDVRNSSFSGAMERYKPVSYLISMLNETNTVECRLESNTLIFKKK